MSGGEDGRETPPAPESPSPETPSPEPPQEPIEAAAEEGAEPAAEEQAESRRPRLLPVWILLGAAALSGGAWAVMEMRGGGPPADEASVPLITASAEPWKVRPADPGGMEIPNQGTLIYETLTTADPEEAPERVLPPPEEPMSPPQPEIDRAEELAVAASGERREDTALQPDAAGAEEPEPAPAEEASPPEPEAPAPALPEEAPPPEDEALTEAVLVEELPPTEPEAPMAEFFPMPHPPKPGTPAATGELPELDPETLALVEDLLQPEDEPTTAPAQEEYTRQEYVGSVPLPVYKPARVAGTAPARRRVDDAASRAREPSQEPVQSESARTWRYVQLGAANSRGPLEGHWEMLRRDHGDVLVGLSPLIMPVDSGDSGITYRLRAGPLSDAGVAQRVCAQLKERGLACFVPRD